MPFLITEHIPLSCLRNLPTLNKSWIAPRVRWSNICDSNLIKIASMLLHWSWFQSTYFLCSLSSIAWTAVTASSLPCCSVTNPHQQSPRYCSSLLTISHPLPSNNTFCTTKIQITPLLIHYQHIIGSTIPLSRAWVHIIKNRLAALVPDPHPIHTSSNTHFIQYTLSTNISISSPSHT